VLEEVHVTLSSQPTSFGSVAELKMRIHALEAAGAELARNADKWQSLYKACEERFCIESDGCDSDNAVLDALERQQSVILQYQRRALVAEAQLDEPVTTVDQSAELRAVKRELLRTQDALATALQSWSGSLLDSAVEAIRQAKKRCAWPRRYQP
jgi:hypothetical protein